MNSEEIRPVEAPLTEDAQSIWRQGLWHRNVALIQLLGLCPLLAVTTTIVNSLGLALATLFVVTCSNALVSMARKLLQPQIRIPAFILIIASLVTTAELLMSAWLPELNRNLGIFVPLIVTNCAIVARAEAFASREPLGRSVLDGLATGAGFAWVLIAVGAIRELIGNASLLADWHLLVGGTFTGLQFADQGFLLALLPPGAFFALALVLIFRNLQRLRHE